MIRWIGGVLAAAVALWSAEVDDIIKRVEDQMRGETNRGSYEMIVETPRWKRTIKMEGWAKGKEKSFIHITYPMKDKGITFLKLDNEMWQYVPRIERTIKIPPSMMLQSWMGSDFTNDDLVKESSMEDDYDASLLEEDDTVWRIRLIPKEEAAVVWGKLIVDVQKATYVPVKEEFYDEDGEMVRVMRFSDIKKLDDRYIATTMVIEPLTEDKQGNRTIMHLQDMEYNVPIDDGIFTERALRQMSKR